MVNDAAMAFAELMAGEKAVRAEMSARVRTRCASDDPLRKLGLAGGDRAPKAAIASTAVPINSAPRPTVAAERSLDQLVACALSKAPAARGAVSSASRPLAAGTAVAGAPAEASAAPAERSAARGGLETVLALRKTQVGKAAIAGQLSSLRSGKDSDDDDDDEEEAVPAAGAHGGGGTGDATTFDRALNMLGDASITARHGALQQLLGLRLSRSQHKAVLRPILLRFADPAERCRDAAVCLFGSWVDTADAADVAGCLPFLVPALVERIGTRETAEPSEEVRAKLVSICTTTMFKARALLRPYLNDLGAICLGACRDSNPAVIKAACALIALVGREVLPPMVKLMGGKAVQPYSAKLVEALLPHLRHRHAAVRVATLDALEHALLAGAGSSVETLVGWRLVNNVPIAEFYGKGEVRRNWLADLSRDGSLQVRRRFLATLTRWVRQMDGADLYEQEVRLYPYLLNLLVDPDATLRSDALAALTALGEEYLALHDDEWRDKMAYGAADEADRDRRLNIPLPHPFCGRPPLGARVRVRNHFRALIHPIVAEIGCWTAKERCQSAALLEVLLIFVEGSATEFGHMVLPAVAKAAAEADEHELRQRACRCAEVFAHHVDPRSYMPLLIQMSSLDPLNTLSQRLGYFAILPSLLRGMYRVEPATPPASGPTASATPAAHAHAALTMLCGVCGGDGAATSQHAPLRDATRATLLELCALEVSGRLPADADALAFSSSRDKLERLPRDVYDSPPPVAGAPFKASLTLGLLLWHGSDPALAAAHDGQAKAAEARRAAGGGEAGVEEAPELGAERKAEVEVAAAWACVERRLVQDAGVLLGAVSQPSDPSTFSPGVAEAASSDAYESVGGGEAQAAAGLLRRFYARLHPLVQEQSHGPAPFASDLLDRIVGSVGQPTALPTASAPAAEYGAVGSAEGGGIGHAPRKVLAVEEVESFEEGETESDGEEDVPISRRR